jgi:hypothetical protein
MSTILYLGLKELSNSKYFFYFAQMLLVSTKFHVLKLSIQRFAFFFTQKSVDKPMAVQISLDYSFLDVHHKLKSRLIHVCRPCLFGLSVCSWPNIRKRGRATAQAVSRRLRTAAACVRAWVTSWFVVAKVIGTGFLRVLRFPCQFIFHRLLHIHHHLSSGAGTIGQLVADVPNGLSLTGPHEIEKI